MKDRSRHSDVAVKRMQAIGFSEDIINDFQNGIVHISSSYVESIDEIDGLREKMDSFTKGTIYHIIHTILNVNNEDVEMCSFLYVSDFPQDWKYEMDSLSDGEVFAFVWNTTWGIEEIGSIGVTIENNILRRIW